MTKNVRARDLGLPVEGEAGRDNALTDVPGVEVGFTTIIEGDGAVVVGQGPVRTGVTAILPRGRGDRPSPIWAGLHSFNGNGEMTGSHWINDAGYFQSPICITNTHSVGMAHHGTVKWMIDQYGDYFREGHRWALPVIAETYDGVLNDICGCHITEDHVLAALNGAQSGPVAEGNVGGGTGMICYEFKGGTGTASRRLGIGGGDFVVGALVQANFGARRDLMIYGVPVGQELTENAVHAKTRRAELGSIIAIVGTDIPLSPVQLQRLAKRATLGVARTGSSGGNGSGDIFLAFSTANGDGGETDSPDSAIRSFDILDEDRHIDEVFRAAVQAVEEAIINAMIAGETLSAVKPAGFDVTAIDHDALRAVMGKYGRLSDG